MPALKYLIQGHHCQSSGKGAKGWLKRMKSQIHTVTSEKGEKSCVPV